MKLWLALPESSAVIGETAKLVQTTVTGVNHSLTLPPTVQKLLLQMHYSGLQTTLLIGSKSPFYT